jgi:hypothetical protein
VRSIRDVAGTELVWVQQRGLNFELRSGDEVVATLKWQPTSRAVGETAEHQWSFDRSGFLRLRVTVRVPGSDANVELFRYSWKGGGTLDLGTGRQLSLGQTSFWRGRWDWTDELKRPLVHFKKRGLLAMGCQVEIEKEATTSPDLDLLVVLGWYLHVLRFLDASAGSGA